jgi:predicted transposase/invertase (TIGR01784 family)
MTTIADSFRQEGMKMGLQHGMQQGMQQGIHLAKLEDARKMLIERLDIALIARITELSLEEICAEAIKLNIDNH